jgi:Tol biopolymer transport system component/predicted Ser/Thr protein kinase
MIGKTVSHYRILEKLGEGGMGVVYKAHDTKLDRVVALKFLPHYLTSDPTEKERFYHEARAASALLHANVAVVFEINGQDDQLFIAMEYVEGKTLKEILEEEPLTIKQVLDIAIQVCDGLAAAHEKGIVHRDIKSENIIVTGKGQPKITDFGLAKMKGAAKLTKTGSTLGTAAYMSPEQARGEEVDHRSDIFSFGVVLYEMLTGRLPFRGEHHAALLYSILNDEPQPIVRFNEKATPEIEHIVAKALEKDRDDRYQHADEMLADLRRERKKIDYVKTGTVAAPAAAEARRSRRQLSRRLWYGLGALAVLIVVAIAYLFIWKQPSRVVLNPDMTFRVLPTPFAEVGSPGLSQDGNWAAFPAADENGIASIQFMNTTSGESRRITSDYQSWYVGGADVSPDGSQVVYNRENESGSRPEIAIVSSVGGPSKRIVDLGWGPRWRPDGQRIGYVCIKGYGSQSGKAEIRTVRPNGTDDRCELVDSTSTEARRFSWSPDGRSVCWIRYFSEQWKELIVYELSTKKARQVTFDKKGISDVCWAPNGQIVFSSNKTGNYNLWMVPESGGAATQITKGVGPDYYIAISRDGSKLLYLQRQAIGHIWLAGTDGSNVRQITFDDAFLWRVSFSPDGTQILFGFAQPVGSKEGYLVCSIDRDGGNRKQLTSGEESINNPIMSPDGRWIIYGKHSLSTPWDSSMVYLLDARNPGTPRRVGRGAPMRWVDGTTFITWETPSAESWLCGIDGREAKKFFEDSTWAIPLQGGKYVGYADTRAGREGLWICAAPGVKDPGLPSPKKIAPLVVSGEFDKNGRYFYFVKNAGELRRISIPSGKEEIIHGVFPGLNFSGSWFDISFDGKEIVYTDARPNCKLVMIENAFK